jgi:GTP diphosphokinase / guanosine-3',5'-bis(diphosphate) 3'-diphosphatase
MTDKTTRELIGSPNKFTKEQWAKLTLEQKAQVTGRTLEEQAGVEEFDRKIGQSLVDGLNRHVVGETIIDEMARRHGEWLGPQFHWEAATPEFKTRFNNAYAKKPSSQSADDFAREFVDQWPLGLAVLRYSNGQEWPEPMPGDELYHVLRAAAFAAQRHRDQRRKGADASPYINHPLALAKLLSGCGERDPIVLMAALLHDTVEDTGTTVEELEHAFSREVASVVAEVTDDKSLPKAERKRLQIEHAARLSDRAALVKLADKICNLRDIAASPPVDWSLERRREYFDWAKQVVDQIQGKHTILKALFEEAYAKRP